jgi:hypothetical protein
MNALLDLYTATHGDSWHWTPQTVHWNFSGSPNPCLGEWYGIECTSSPTNGSLRVESLQLASFNLNGTVPASMGLLSALNILDLSYNHLTGDIPDGLSDLKDMNILYLDYNYLNGTIPTSLGNLIALTDIRLGTNYLAGSRSCTYITITSTARCRQRWAN